MLPALAKGTLLAGRYQLDAPLGAGEVGVVHAALDQVSGRECVVKVFASTLRQMPAAWRAFQELERAVAALDVTAVARASDFGIDTELGLKFVVSERIGFPSLDELLKVNGRVELAALAAAFEVIAASLDTAAEKGLFHGDLKPQNLFLMPGNPGWARVSDYGVAELRQALLPAAAPLGWATPERARGAPPSRADDIFALGLIAFYALTGRHYCRAMWQADPDVGSVLSELESRIESASLHARTLGADLPATLDRWFSRALALDSAQRFPSAGVAARELSTIAHEVPAPQPGVAAAVAAPLVFQKLPPREAEKAPLSAAFVPSEPRPASDLPRSSRPPSVQPPRPKPREHVDGLPNAPPIFLLAAAATALLLLLALGAVLTWRLFGRSSDPPPSADSAAGSAQAPLGPATPAPAPSAQNASTEAAANFSCTPESCEWIVCDGEKVKTGLTTLVLPPGRHSCSASRYGFRTAVVEFTLEPGKTTNVVFELLATKTVPRSAPKAKPKPKPKSKPASAPKAATSR